MLPSLWLSLTAGAPSSADEQALARYYRAEGLQVELEALRYRGTAAIPMEHERVLYAAHSYLAA
jgi:hypothetical protein